MTFSRPCMAEAGPQSLLSLDQMTGHSFNRSNGAGRPAAFPAASAPLPPAHALCGRGCHRRHLPGLYQCPAACLQSYAAAQLRLLQQQLAAARPPAFCRSSDLRTPPSELALPGVMGPSRQPAARKRGVRLAVVGTLAALALWVSTSSSSSRSAGERAAGRRALEGAPQAARTDGGSSPGDASLADGQPRGKYALPQHELEALVAAASEVHGQVSKEGPLPAEHWADGRRPGRERAFLQLLLRGACCPGRWHGRWAACWLARLADCSAVDWLVAMVCCRRRRQQLTFTIPCLHRPPLTFTVPCPHPLAHQPPRHPPPTPALPDMAEPRSPQYWATDAVSGEQALRPLARPYPLCHLYVNHRYKIIFIVHPKRWALRSAALRWAKRCARVCRTSEGCSAVPDRARSRHCSLLRAHPSCLPAPSARPPAPAARPPPPSATCSCAAWWSRAARGTRAWSLSATRAAWARGR